MGAVAGVPIFLVYGRPTNFIQASTLATYGESDDTISDISWKPEPRCGKSFNRSFSVWDAKI